MPSTTYNKLYRTLIHQYKYIILYLRNINVTSTLPTSYTYHRTSYPWLGRLLLCCVTCILIYWWTTYPELDVPTIQSNISKLSSTINTNQSTQNRRILLISYDISGPNKNGGIGTAQYHMSRILSQQHTVTLLHAGTELVTPQSEHDFTWWQSYYTSQYNITLLSLPTQLTYQYQATAGTDEMIRSYEVYLYLLHHHAEYDIVHIHDWRGLPYYTLMAKQQGKQELQQLIFITICHSISLWSRLGEQHITDTINDLIIDYMERQTVQWSEYIVTPSMYMIQWMNQHQYTYGKAKLLHQYNPITTDTVIHPVDSNTVIHEIVFFGRIDHRKGIDIFIDAIELLYQKINYQEFRVTLLGKLSTDIDGTLQQRINTHVSDHQWKILSSMSSIDAIRYLTESNTGRLAVICSRVENSPYTVQEALYHHIPFIASNVGGTAELIHVNDHARCLFELDGNKLYTTILNIINQPYQSVQSAVDFNQINTEWIQWHTQLQSTHTSIPSQYRTPLVSIVIPTYNRTEYVLDALKSLSQQTYQHIEVIVVDDGTSDTAGINYLNTVVKPYIDQYRNYKLIYSTHQQESATRNAGAQYATGEYILFMDDDNIAKSHEIQTFIDVMLYTNADLLTCFVDRFDTNILPATPEQTGRWLLLGPARMINLYVNTIGDANFMIKKSVFHALGGFDVTIGTIAEDYEFLVNAIYSPAQYNIQVIPDALVWKRSTALTELHITQSNQNQLALSSTVLKYLPHDIALTILTMKQAYNMQLQQIETILANSQIDFYPIQHIKQWTYTYKYIDVNKFDNTHHMLDTTLHFLQSHDNTRKSQIQAYQYKSQNLPSYCTLSYTSQHPCITDQGIPISIYRNWLSNVQDQIIITGTVTRLGRCGTGTVLTIELDDEVIYDIILEPNTYMSIPMVQTDILLGQSMRFGVHVRHDTEILTADCSQVDMNININLVAN